MIGIIWFVVVVYIVVRCINNTKKNDKDGNAAKKKQSQQANRAGAYQTGGKWSNQQPQRVQQKRNAPQQKKSASQQKTQQKRSAAGGYGTTARPAQPVKKTENVILQKAKANAEAQFATDTLEARGKAVTGKIPEGDEILRDLAFDRHIHSVHDADTHGAELRNEPGIDDFDTYHLVEEVQNLIVMGYSGNLEFERDFLAEGMDMLNRVSGW